MDSDAATTTMTRTRIYIGGLGASVTEGDIRKTFSALGQVRSVDFVRTNSRNFAYIDFDPSSPKSLSKLFASYNGCIWKGGCLRLEKAKEHYLDRLRREWTEASELKSSTTPVLEANKHLGSIEKSKNPSKEKMELRMFIPKLKKVKTLPMIGLCKHKYSFQRIEVPPLPIHFCDCEEHCQPSETSTQKHIPLPDTQISVMNEEELNIMTSVMNKLLDKENVENAADGGSIEQKNFDDGMCSSQHNGRETDDETDEDNLLTNIVTGENKNGLGSKLDEWETFLVDQVSGRSHSSKEMPRKPGCQKRLYDGSLASETMMNKKACISLAGGNGEGEVSSVQSKKKKLEKIEPQTKSAVQENLETHLQAVKSLTDPPPTETHPGDNSNTGKLSKGPFWMQRSSWKEMVGNSGSSSFSISQIVPGSKTSKQKTPKSDKSAGAGEELPMESAKSRNPEIYPEDVERLTDPPPAEIHGGDKPSTDKTSAGPSWMQKTSWKEMAGENSNSSFSIYCILPGITSMKQKMVKPDETCAKSHNFIEKDEPKHSQMENLETRMEQSIASKDTEMVLEKGDDARGGPEEVQNEKQEEKGNQEPNMAVGADGGRSQKAVPDSNGEVCAFMRTAESLREWSKLRATLGRGLKRRNSEGNSSKISNKKTWVRR
ncbi:hypothetical protein QJS10_CPA02g01623 [Acorus calamus]|uniref:RRM domain-containing protein n=1 Tax=Acorus calamus TaxID=4465 RepID=A0AAV9FCH6_ACOCL|nr:hypothetical protein QJS10_CPA02g01623 [Acorus calamus]